MLVQECYRFQFVVFGFVIGSVSVCFYNNMKIFFLLEFGCLEIGVKEDCLDCVNLKYIYSR